MNGETAYWFAWLVFLLTYLGLALGKFPGLRMDRAGIALVGATLLMVGGVLPVDEAVHTCSQPRQPRSRVSTIEVFFHDSACGDGGAGAGPL
jgi:hypothetical protein